MSAIAGIYHQNHEPVSREHIHAMMGSLEQFPADDVRVYKKDHIFLGCHAQWITPESIGEILPFYDNERKLAITADAIIDNRQELFNSLGVRHALRKGISDSELILLAYEKWGEECPEQLIGDFSFMIWDERKEKLFGARDFAGSRTLYYHASNQRFAFATTIKSLLSLAYINGRINEEWIAEFLVIPDMFNTVDVHSTVYSNVLQVPPSHSIVIQSGKTKLTRYSKFDSRKKLKLNSNLEYEEAFRDVFQRAVSDRLRTFKKVGSQLSGGLDSGSVVSFASRELNKQNQQLYTYSYIPQEDFIDWTPKSRIANERPFIQSTVNFVGNIQGSYLDFKNRTPLKEINEWLDILEMPYKFFNNSYWLRGIYEEASNHGVGILLNGARGNWTISYGTAIDYYSMLLKKMQLIKFYKEINDYYLIKKTGRKRVVQQVSRRAFPLLLSPKNKYKFPQFINKDFAKNTNVYQKVKENGLDITGSQIPNLSEARDRQFQNLYYWTNGASSTKMSLRYSLWNRDPTNDLRIIEFCLSLPDSQFVQHGVDRSLIRRATENYLPNKVRLNHQFRGAQGVDVIHRMIDEWDLFRVEMEEMLNDQIMSDLVDIEVLSNAYSKIKDNPLPEDTLGDDLKILMRSLILFKFIKESN
ncbi:asparagine synthase-related protein [Rossellomorea sp. DA94]|uniref:asparagine synthase-related protein n=1 Tax=Rossellomorea sp. DA94 TaxID=3038653 RepID=UPI00244C886A|nr:asparagine synthase-related protein [Rossellomorea sp. DA94]WGG45874.1 asparagine synthase-related protein [Rossellomorea sp. DA94]